jgi:transposase-like protein
MPEYSLEFKRRMVAKMVGPDGRSASGVSEETGIPQPTLSRWKRKLSEAEPLEGKRPQDWTASERFEAVLEASRLSDAELGEFLRRRGLHASHVEQWRRTAEEALAPRPRRSRKRSKEKQEIRRLERELDRKEKALAETAALLVLKKKADSIWGVEDAGTTRKNGK